MYLLIDTSERDAINLALFDKSFIEHKTYSAKNRELLECIEKMFRVQSSKFRVKNSPLERGALSDSEGRGVLDGIMVVVGSGGFTSTRIATVVANTFAYVMQIPLLAIKKEEVENIQKLIPKLLKQKPGHYLSATYSGEANIGKKK